MTSDFGGKPEFCLTRRKRYLSDPLYLEIQTDRDAIREELRLLREGRVFMPPEKLPAARILYESLAVANRRLFTRASELDRFNEEESRE